VPPDIRGQGGGNRDGYLEKLNEREARAKYADAAEKEEAGLRRPSLLERFKRWFSAKF
jgi:hypothetical protein